MSWLTLGTIIPDKLNWTPFGPQVSGGELFRVTQSWDGLYPGPGYAQIRQRWDPEGVWDYDRIYPNKDEPHLLRLSIPGEFRAADKLARIIECRQHSRAIIPVNSNWAITLQVWTGPTLQLGTPAPGNAISTPTSGPIAPVINTDPGLYGVITNDPGTYD